MKITIPTLLTFLRIILMPLIISSMVQQWWGVAFALFLIAAITDVLDGALARLWNEQTVLGAVLDPIADKLLVLSIFGALAFVQSPLFHIPLWFVLIVFIKEMLLILGSVAIYLATGSLEIAPTWLGKISMIIQVIFITWLFACYFFEWLPIKTYYTMLGVVILCASASLLHYLSIGLCYLSKNVLTKATHE
jgi:cardiolipin synthase (CMP-forming)